MTAHPRVLVTGATGFIGRQVAAALVAQGCEVIALVRRAPEPGGLLETIGCAHAVADLTDPGDVARAIAPLGASHLVHTAWASVVSGLWTSPENIRWLMSSLALAEAFLDAGGRRIVAAGSCGEYDWTAGLCREGTTPLTPSTIYGSTKVALYHGLEAMTGARNAELAWGRFFFLYGPGEHESRLGASVVKATLAGDRVAVSHGLQLRDYMHVADAGAGLAALALSDLQGAYNLATGEAVRVREVILALAGETGGAQLVDIGARPAAAHEPPLIVADMAKTRAALVWTPRFDLSTGAADTVAWFKARESASSN